MAARGVRCKEWRRGRSRIARGNRNLQGQVDGLAPTPRCLAQMRSSFNSGSRFERGHSWRAALPANPGRPSEPEGVGPRLAPQVRSPRAHTPPLPGLQDPGRPTQPPAHQSLNRRQGEARRASTPRTLGPLLWNRPTHPRLVPLARRARSQPPCVRDRLSRRGSQSRPVRPEKDNAAAD